LSLHERNMSMHHWYYCNEHGKTIRFWNFAALSYTKRSEKMCMISKLAVGFCIALLALTFSPHLLKAAENPEQLSNQKSSLSANQVTTRLNTDSQSVVVPYPKRADFEGEHKSQAAQQVADWVVDLGDNHGMPFGIVDKKEAKVFVFDPAGRLRGAAPVLLGLAKGDESIPGIGDKKLSEIRPDERTTPAGRFVASLGLNFSGKDVLWVDYDGAVSMHRVVTSNPKERRLERLATPSPLDNRISFGCINVPAKFFDNVIIPTFTGTYAVVYVLPEIRSIREVFDRNYDFESNGKQTELKTPTDEKSRSTAASRVSKKP